VGTNRLEAFSDGVLAIAITLLILEVKVPAAASGRLGHDLLHQWPSYASYVVSFAVIGIIWVNHHAMFERIARVSRTLLFLNLLLLMTVAFLPFPTALLAAYVNRGGRDAHVAAAVYGLAMELIGLGFMALWVYLARTPDVLVEGFTAANAAAAVRRTVVGPLLYLVAIALAFVSAPLSLAVYGAVAVYFVLPGREARASPAGGPTPARR
jgi:uncharacterized membrane protein